MTSMIAPHQRAGGTLDFHDMLPRDAILVIDPDECFRLGLREVLRAPLSHTDILFVDTFTEAMSFDLGQLIVRLLVIGNGALRADGVRLYELSGRFSAARVIIMGISRNKSDVFDALSVGAHGYIAKGTSSAELVEGFKVVFQGGHWIPREMLETYARNSSLDLEPAQRSITCPDEITPRQREVLRLLIEGRSNKEIARRLRLREGTIKVHVAGLFRNLGVNNRARAAVIGARLLAPRNDQMVPD